MSRPRRSAGYPHEPGDLDCQQPQHVHSAGRYDACCEHDLLDNHERGNPSADRASFQATNEDAETGETGWSIGDGRLYRSGETDSWTTQLSSLLIAIKGTTGGYVASTDATLKTLALEGATGGETITLSPAFDDGTGTYTASVVNRIDSVKLTATKNDSNATVAITDDDDSNTPEEAELALIVGSNTLTVTVTAENGTPNTYTITVTRAAAPPVPTDCPADTTWCTTMTAGYNSGTLGQSILESFGYRADANFGDLGSTMFSHGGTPYSVTGIYRLKVSSLDVNTANTDKLNLTVSPALPDGTIYQVGSRTFPVGTDSATSTAGQEQWDLRADPPSWTAAQHVTVSLRLLDPGVTLSPTTLTVTEEETTGDSYTVVLDSQPTADVEVMVAGYSGTAVTPTPSTLTFTSVNWQTSQTVTVKAGADADTENDTVTLTHSAASTDSNYDGSSITIASVTVTVNDDDIDNAAPTFNEGGSTTRTFNETIGDATVGTASDIGTPVSATDLDTGDTLEYSLEGTDRTKFGINATSGQIRTKVGENYDYEARTSYSVMVTVTDGTVTVSSTVTINVTDQDEPPPVMNQPVVTATANSTTSLEVSWTAPSNLGRPGIDSYDLQYRVGNTGDFSNGPQNQTGGSAAIGNLTADTSYEVRVRATNAEGDGVWSPSGTGQTNAEDNAAPTFNDGGSTTRTFDETIGDTAVTSASDIGTPVSAMDPDTGDTLEYRLEGTDMASFGIIGTNGQLRTKSGQKYDYEAETSYSVTVRVVDSQGASDTIAVTINVTDQNEPPPVMNQPVVTATANSTTSLEVSWTAPSNLGRPRIDSYDLQYRVGRNGGFSNGPQDETGSSAAIGNLTADTSYEVRVRAINAEGDGVWSPSGTGQTNAEDNAAPGVTVSETALTVTEEDPTGESYTVVLDSQPTAEVVVTVAGHAGTEVTPTPTSLTFTRSNWDTGQTVTVTAGSDADTLTDTVTLTHSAASADSDYDGNSITIASVTVTVTDDDIDTTAGICGRTEEVRNALLALIPGVSDCTAVTDADLGAITGPLNLSGQNISVLAAGDFAGLTALIELYLNNNGLTTLPKDVFAGLTSLEVLTLYYNDLETLPDGVFEPLTALNFLYLGDNPRAPFAPTAVALPVAGTVPVAGGTVTLDGSGSGGPWGTNVTYRWALTTPASGVRVTFDDSTSATPEVAIPTLAARTELTFTLTVTGRGGTDGIETATATARVTATQNITNNPPVFAGGAVQARTFNETIGDATVGTASDIGTPVSATDPDTGDTLEYRLEGTDRTKFGINATSGQIQTKVGENYDYEARTRYSVTVAVTDRTVTVSSTVTINVTDQDEPPPVMNQPVVTATANSTTSLEVSWTAPSNLGRPRIDSYDLQYRVGRNGGFSNGPQDETGSSAAIGNLTADTSYEVRVRAINAEGDGVWSPSGTGQTNAEDNAAPGVTVSETALTVTEEDPTGESYTVVLDSQPTAEVVVTVAGHSGTAVTPTPTRLTFTRSNWDTGQTVTVTAGSDADTVNDTVTLTHSAASADSYYDGNSITIASVTVTVNDNDIDIAAATLSGLELEGATGSEPIDLSPAFDADTITYTAVVANRINGVKLTATKNDSNATVVITNDDDLNTPGEADLALNVGSNTLTLTVTAEDGTPQTYTITVTRAAAPPVPTDCPADTDWCTTMGVGNSNATTNPVKLYISGYRSDRSFGDLGSTMFSHGGTSYSVSGIYRIKVLYGTPVFSEDFNLLVSSDLPDGTVLQVGSRTFTVGTDSVTGAAGHEAWDIQADPLNWMEGQHVTVSLKFPITDPPGVTVSPTALTVSGGGPDRGQLQGGPRQPTDGGGRGDGGRARGHGGDPEPDQPDFHHVELGHGPDGDGYRGQ